MPFVLDVKPSARRHNGAVGSLVNRRGTRYRFPTREDAETWADGLTARGERPVWVRAANPDDGTGADGYLVSRRPVRRGSERTEGGEQAAVSARDDWV